MMRMGLMMGALLVVASARAEVVISEFMAANRTTLRDARGEASDWIELHNRGEAAVELTGWHLTDDPGEPMQWTFPAVTLPPDGFLLVFASGRAGTPGGELHTGFRLL